MNANIKNEIINGEFPQEFKDWVNENPSKLHYHSVEGVVKGFIKSQIPYENPENWLFSVNNTKIGGFLLKLEKTELPNALYAPSNASGYTIKAFYKENEYHIYDVTIHLFKP